MISLQEILIRHRIACVHNKISSGLIVDANQLANSPIYLFLTRKYTREWVSDTLERNLLSLRKLAMYGEQMRLYSKLKFKGEGAENTVRIDSGAISTQAFGLYREK